MFINHWTSCSMSSYMQSSYGDASSLKTQC